MPKKQRGENSKAVEARARKADAKAAAAAQKQKEMEDAYWKDDDKHVNRKLQRKSDKEQRRQEELARKQEKKKLLEEEESSLKVHAKAPAAKVTRAQVEANQERIRKEKAAEAAASKKQLSHLDIPLEENTNIILAREEEEGVVSARDVGEAISALSLKDSGAEKHPEKRVKAAFAAFEETRLPELKAENPNLRLSQLKQMLKKEWMKSPDNPLNQKFESFNTKK